MNGAELLLDRVDDSEAVFTGEGLSLTVERQKWIDADRPSILDLTVIG